MARPRIDYKGKSLVDVANEHVPLVVLLRRWMEVPEIPYESSVKLNCPWSYTHPDGGADKGFRVYGPPSNSAFCFVQCGTITPVRLYAEQNSMSFQDAARYLLDEFDLKPLHWTERAERALLQFSDVSIPQTSLQGYAQALVVAVKGHMKLTEYSPEWSAWLQEAHTELEHHPNPEEWLETWKAKIPK